MRQSSQEKLFLLSSSAVNPTYQSSCCCSSSAGDHFAVAYKKLKLQVNKVKLYRVHKKELSNSMLGFLGQPISSPKIGIQYGMLSFPYYLPYFKEAELYVDHRLVPSWKDCICVA